MKSPDSHQTEVLQVDNTGQRSRILAVAGSQNARLRLHSRHFSYSLSRGSTLAIFERKG